MSRKTQVFLAVLTLCAAMAVAYLLVITKSSATKEPPESIRLPVQVFVAAPEDRHLRVVGWGTVVPARKILLQAEVGGRIIYVSTNAVPGGIFKAGEKVVRIDPRDYEYAVTQRSSELLNSIMELDIEKGRKAIAAREWNLLEGDVPVTEHGRRLALREPQMSAMQAAVAAASSRESQAKLNLDRTRVESPFNALVLSENVDIGQLVSPQTVLAELAGTDNFWVRVLVPVDRLRWIDIPGVNASAGSLAKIAFNAGDDVQQRIGMVERLLGDLEPRGRMARLIVSVHDPLDLSSRAGMEKRELPLLLGSYVKVTIRGREFKKVYVLPRKALREGGVVWLMNSEDELEIRPVTLLESYAQTVVVSKGLSSGDRVITSRISSPLPGMKLRIAGGRESVNVEQAFDGWVKDMNEPDDEASQLPEDEGK